MDIVFSASIIASFLAGMVALFAPCCITILLPTYIASVFKEKGNIMKMTFIFFAGIAVVLIPIGLGAASLAMVFQTFHQQLYIIGGLFMIFLAFLSLSGRGMAILPMPKTSPRINAADPKSIFLLGVFSGAATSCCAPVLLGAVTLAVLSGVFWKAMVVTFAYVFGMTFPLFLAAYFYDRFNLGNSNFIQGKVFKIKIGNEIHPIHSTKLLSAVIFFGMGLILLSLSSFGAFWAPSYQVRIGEALNKWSESALKVLANVPDLIWGIIIVGAFFFFLYKAKKSAGDKNYGNTRTDQ